MADVSGTWSQFVLYDPDLLKSKSSLMRLALCMFGKSVIQSQKTISVLLLMLTPAKQINVTLVRSVLERIKKWMPNEILNLMIFPIYTFYKLIEAAMVLQIFFASVLKR